MIRKILTIIMLAVSACMFAQSGKTPAFPGAEGFGRYTTGGRGGAVYHVTSLDDDPTNAPAGTFRHACNQKGVRTIVFDISGTIQLKGELKLSNGNVTIAGQTAPGDGVCIAGYPFVIGADNVIIRFVRFRLGNENVAHHKGDGLSGMDRSNIIIDHCSVSWSIDECLSVYGCKDFTVQWCIAAQSLVNSGHAKGAHGYGGNWGGSGASYHHNLMAHHASRVPRLGPRSSTQTDERMDLRNNVFYNFGGNGCYGGEGMNVNIVNNYYKPGPATKSGTFKYRLAAPGVRTVDYCIKKEKTIANYNNATGKSLGKGDISGSSDYGKKNYLTINGTRYEIDMSANTITVDGKTVTVVWNDWKPMLHKWGTFYVDGNYNPSSADMNNDNFKYGVADQIAKSGTDVKNNDGTYPGDENIKLSAPIEYVYTTTHSAEDAFERVLAFAGASLHRDALDAAMVKDAREGGVTYGQGKNGLIDSQDECGGFPVLNSAAAPKDTDGDGMPDAWEEANGLDKNNANDGKTAGADGYTNLEKYMNSLVEDIIEGGNAGGTGDDTQEPESEVADYYDITPATNVGNSSKDPSPWTFNGGFKITNTAGKGYGTCGTDYLKYAKNTEFAITIPNNMSIEKIEFTGFGYGGTTTLDNVNGTSCAGAAGNGFPAEATDAVPATFTVTPATPFSKAVTFKIGGVEAILAIRLYPVKNAVTQAGGEYTVSELTNTGVNTNGTWNFDNGITVTNTKDKGYGTGNNNGVKYSAGVQFTINLPEGVSVDRVKISGYNNYDTGDSYLSELNGMTFSNTDYVFPRKGTDGKAVTKEYIISLGTPASNMLIFKAGGNQVVWSITLYMPQEVTIHEQSVALSVPDGPANVTLVRTLSPDYWNSFCVPFDITPEMIESVMGGAEVAEFTSVDGDVMMFSAVSDGVKAGVPCIIKPAKKVVNPCFAGVTINTAAPQGVSIDGCTYRGTYVKYAMTYGGTELMLNTRNSLSRPKPAPDNVMRGLRAYFVVPEASVQSARLMLPDNTVTGIADMATGIKPAVKKGVYNLNGQFVGNSIEKLPCGIYISGGKKIVIGRNR